MWCGDWLGDVVVSVFIVLFVLISRFDIDSLVFSLCICFR